MPVFLTQALLISVMFVALVQSCLIYAVYLWKSSRLMGQIETCIAFQKCWQLADMAHVHALSKINWPLGLMLLALVMWVLPAHAGIHACPSPGGGTVFQDRPCSEDAKPKNTNAPETRSELPLFGLHDSWFERPIHAGDRAFCDKRGCECGQLEDKFESGLAQAVADALYIDGNWHRYETGVDSWLNSKTTAAESYVMQLEVQDAACEIMMAQETIRMFANDVLRVLQRRADQAIASGNDKPSACNGNSDKACTSYTHFELFRRMVIDLQALELERVSYYLE